MYSVTYFDIGVEWASTLDGASPADISYPTDERDKGACLHAPSTAADAEIDACEHAPYDC